MPTDLTKTRWEGSGLSFLTFVKYVRRGYRRQGIMSALIAAALKAAKRDKTPALEAYPVDKVINPAKPTPKNNALTAEHTARGTSGGDFR